MPVRNTCDTRLLGVYSHYTIHLADQEGEYALTEAAIHPNVPHSPGPMVAIIDTGISPERVPNAVVLPGVNVSGEGDSTETTDPFGHGTAVAATIARLAPGVHLLPVRLLNRCGILEDRERVTTAFGWILEHFRSLGVGLVCATFADSSHELSDADHRDSELQRLIAALRAAGVLTVAPAGNWYPEHRAWRKQGMAWPAILREVVSVGALERGPDGLGLTRNTQRLHAETQTGCSTTVFVEPGEPGETSGAAAIMTGALARLRQQLPDASAEVLVQRLLDQSFTLRDRDGLDWPAIEFATLL